MKKVLLLLVLSVSSMTAFSNTLSCFVDTPRVDRFTEGYCEATIFGNTFTGQAVFALDNPPAHSELQSILWTDSACSTGSTSCLVPLKAFNPKTVTATVLLNDGTFYQASATALLNVEF